MFLQCRISSNERNIIGKKKDTLPYYSKHLQLVTGVELGTSVDTLVT